jgi:hypothetical protein
MKYDTRSENFRLKTARADSYRRSVSDSTEQSSLIELLR